METAAKPSPAPRVTDRTLEALSTLAAFLDRTIGEVKSLDKEIDARLLRAIEEKEAAFQKLASENLDRAVREANEQLRREFSETADAQMNSLRAEFDAEREKMNRELRRTSETATLMDTERARLANELDRMHEEAWAQHEKSLAALNSVRSEFEAQRGGLNQALSQASEAKAVLENERVRLNHEIERVRHEAKTEREKALAAAVEALGAEFEAERERLNHELNRATETNAALEAERLRLTGEIERTRAEAEAEIEKMRATVVVSPPNGGGGSAAAVEAEIRSTQDQLKDILALIDDPSTELSAAIRKNVERSELESYLRGIQFVLKHGR